jgi:hypothetical protein
MAPNLEMSYAAGTGSISVFDALVMPSLKTAANSGSVVQPLE